MPTIEEQFILDILAKEDELPFKELNERCAEQFEGARIILKNLKQKGLVSFDGMIPGFSAIIKYVKPEEREKSIEQARFESVPSIAPAPRTDQEFFVKSLLKKQGGIMSYKMLNEHFSEKYEGLRLILKKMKEISLVDFDGVMPSPSSQIKLLIS